MVYVINAQYCAEGTGLNTKRNILFTAMTRTKAWLRVFGVGENMLTIQNEFEQVRDNGYVLEFKYPTAEERKYLRIVNRDMTEQEKTNYSNVKINWKRSFKNCYPVKYIKKTYRMM